MSLFHRIAVVCVVLVSTVHAQDILFQERFTNGTAENEWVAGFNGTALVPYQTALAPGDGWVGRLTNLASGGNVAQSSAASRDFSNFLYEATIYIPVDAGTYYGIEFRVDPSGLSAGYQFVAAFNPAGTQRMRFRVRPSSNPSIPVAIKDWNASQIPGGIPTSSGWHTLAVKANGPHFFFYFDGQEMPGGLNFDQTFSSGTVGVYLWDMSSPNEELLVDNIKVTSLTTSAVPDAQAQSDFRISSVYPNPATARTAAAQIDVLAGRAGRFEAVVYDALGRAVKHTAVDARAAGGTTLSIPTGGLPAGVYTVSVSSHGATRQQRLIVTN
ncbi:MAG: T9SS type A sorting domain-containing protein [Ignavibacteriae bacterium]|nr:T9SS type A sorting domain-containing protein [Ignavibacteriota bacterium]